MLLNAFGAEWRKIVGNRWVTGFLVWVFPVGVAALVILQLVVALVSPGALQDTIGTERNWMSQMVSAWGIASNFFGRLLLLAFISYVIAGEYQWVTWKNIIPRNSRTALLLGKYLAIAGVILLAFAVTSVLLGVGDVLYALVVGDSLGPRLTGAVLGDFASDYLIQMVLTFAMLLISAGYATLAAIAMRSIIGGIMVSLGIAILEPLIFGLLAVLSNIFDAPRIYHLGRLTAFYNLENVRSWVLNDAPSNFGQIGDPAFSFTDPLWFSLLMVVLWALLLTGLIVVIFKRQDITN